MTIPEKIGFGTEKDVYSLNEKQVVVTFSSEHWNYYYNSQLNSVDDREIMVYYVGINNYIYDKSGHNYLAIIEKFELVNESDFDAVSELIIELSHFAYIKECEGAEVTLQLEGLMEIECDIGDANISTEKLLEEILYKTKTGRYGDFRTENLGFRLNGKCVFFDW